MTRLVNSLQQFGLATELVGQLNEFKALFMKWNAGINLSAARTSDDVLDHVIDSLHVLSHLGAANRVLDVGSGGGFPVVIAALCLPTTSFDALEPVHKKHAFLRTAARELGLKNLESHAERLEQHEARDYDVAMSRATFDLAEWLDRGQAHVRAGGAVIGFEAIRRDDLLNVVRHPYESGDRTRAIVIRRT
jgi:16S rRNA (guanine527-N7)-methyltransferase